MREIRTSGLMSEDGKRGTATAPVLDSTSRPLTLRCHESHSTSGCADVSSRGHFAVVVAGGLGLGWRLMERATGGAAAPRFRRSGAANVRAPVRRLPDPACWSAGAA